MKLTPEQEVRLQEFVAEWTTIGWSTQRADRDQAERVICRLYRLAGLKKPRVIWLPCPLSGALSALVYTTLVANKVLPPLPTGHPSEKLVVDSAIRPARYWNAVYSAVCSAVISALGSAVDSVESAHMSAVRAAYHSDAVYSVVYSAVGSAVGPSVESALMSAFFSAVRSARHLNLVDFAVRSAFRSRHRGFLSPGSAWDDYFDRELSISIDLNYLELEGICGYTWTLDGICFASERPSRINLDNRGRFHSETGQSIVYPSGWGLWHWHGIQVSRYIVEQPEMITVRRIQEEVNVEVRRVMIERYGQVQYLVDSGAKLIHADEMGELYFAEVPGDEPLVMVKVMNSTLESDGSRKPYFLRVHPHCRPLLADGKLGAPQPLTAQSAVASTFGMTADEYAKHLIAQT